MIYFVSIFNRFTFYKITLIFLFFSAFIPSYSQLLPGGEKENYEIKSNNSGDLNSLYSSIDLKGAFLKDNLSLELATKAGLLFGNSSYGIIVSTRISKTVEKNIDTSLKPQAFFNFKYVGLYYEYISSRKTNSFFTAGVSASLAFTSYQMKSLLSLSGLNSIEDYYVLIEPNLGYNVKVSNNNFVGLSLGYRNAIGLWSTKYSNSSFSGAVLTISYKYIK